MRVLLWLFLVVLPGLSLAQSRTVLPQEIEIWVEVEPMTHTPYTMEMVLITIRGIYRRHITRETLLQPDFDGFNWTQLGPDTWREERINGERVKTFTRRMAIYPNRPGTLRIGAFSHNVTLTDENDDWFEHQILSAPVTIDVAPAPANEGWWLPVKGLKVSDEWSNAPDQLARGEGVLRVVRIEALGVTPEMIPPMPVLNSPSAMIFPHPEKRFVELSADGPLSFAFWRWTIRPGNDTSTIVEPLEFTYFDTVNRVDRTVTISAQRVAYGTVVPGQAQIAQQMRPVVPTRLPGWSFAVLAVAVCALGALAAISGHRVAGLQALSRFHILDPLARQLRRAARAGDVSHVRRAAAAIERREGPSKRRRAMVRAFDQSVFARNAPAISLQDFVRRFLQKS